MDKCFSKLTICFEDPFWVGIYEREFNGRYDVCKVIFGSEPKDNEVYEFYNKNSLHLRFSPSISGEICSHKKINPKRLQRCIRSELQKGVGTKAQQAIKLQQEQRKQEQKIVSKEREKQKEEYLFALLEKKRKAKHKGH